MAFAKRFEETGMSLALARKLTPTEAQLLHDEIEGMLKFADYVQQPFVDTKPDSAFALIVRQAIEKFHVDPDKLMERFEVNRTTVGRWKAGTNAPQLMARPLIVGWLADEVRLEAAKLQDQLELALV